MSLTPRQNAFVAEFLKDPNATRAAIAAGFSPKTAASQGSRLLKNVNVARAIDEAMKRRAARVEVTVDDVLRELLCFARTDIGQAFDEQGRLKALKDMPEEVRRAISGIETEELFGGSGEDRVEIGQVRKIKFWDKAKGLELLGKHLKMWTEKVEHHVVPVSVVDPYAEPKK